MLLVPSTTRWGAIISVIKQFVKLKDAIYGMGSSKVGELPNANELRISILAVKFRLFAVST